ncbi:MAG: ATP synthase F1 subunit epsilon [Rhodocyclaceae bacterium]|nr:ATP synthase F1 subunit epsilon [Rhodocyclaceae bacterium]
MSDEHTPALPDALRLEVLTLGQVVYAGEVQHVEIPGQSGHLGVLRGHTPMLVQLAPGALRYQPLDGGEEQSVRLYGGFAEIGPALVRVLADRISREGDEEQERMARARERAEASLQAAESLPTDPQAVKARLDAELLRFFIAAKDLLPPGH